MSALPELLRDFATFLRAGGGGLYSQIESRCIEALPLLSATRKELPKSDPRSGVLLLAIWNLTCMTPAGRAKIKLDSAEKAIECIADIKAIAPESKITFDEAERFISNLPTLDQAFFDRAANSFDAAADAIEPREQSGNSVDIFSDLRLPEKPDQLDLWRKLHAPRPNVESDRKIAREHSATRGEQILRQLISAKNRGKISAW